MCNEKRTKENNQLSRLSQNHLNILDGVASVKQSWQRLDRGSDRQSFVRFQKSLRDLTSAAAAGYTQVADLTSIVDLMLEPVIAGEEKFNTELRCIIRDYLVAARELMEQAPVEQTGPVIPQQVEKGANPEVLLLQSEQDLANEIQRQIAHFGYTITIVDDFQCLLKIVTMRRPHAIIIDDDLVSRGVLSSEHTAELRLHIGQHLPIIFLGKYGDVKSRLAAARAGADVYLVQPIDLHELVDQLDRIDIGGAPEPYHIIVVEDSVTQATYYSAVLKKAGMLTTVVSDPMRVLDAMSENTADLVLMDMYMPGCNGMELAKVIRQVPRHASIPIVYLSAETELNRQLDALSLGGDDFLTKPVNPVHLIRSIAIRAERARILRTLMLTDNLTGLLNHSRIKEQLQTEVARAKRTGSVLSFAMLDIDHFKSINDTHGHPVGDRVIKTLARVLQHRLRQTDYIGRHGGEEFAVILPEACLDKAVMILDQLREDFGKVYQLAPAGAFKVTFSGGVATLTDTGDAGSLAIAADKALYIAKNNGRNCIASYDPNDK